MKSYLLEGLEKLGIQLSQEIINRLIIYGEMLKEKNKIVNLTAIKEDKDIVEKHFLDSLILHSYISGAGDDKKAIDIGTGAGFPGMVLAIANPNIKFTLIDSIGKKTKFLEEVVLALEIRNVEIVNKRAEDYIKDGQREKFDYGFARAVAEIRILNEYVLPFLKKEAVFLAQKAKYEEEVKNAENSFKVLDAEIVAIDTFVLPFSEDNRVIISIKKRNITNEKYPRKAGVVEKNPL